LVDRASRKVPGSAKHANLRRRHCAVVCEAVREGLLRSKNGTSKSKSRTLLSDNQYPNGFCAATRELTASLGGIGADQGIMPAFSDPRALRGYALGHFGRVRLISDLVSQSEPRWLASAMAGAFADDPSLSTRTGNHNDNDNAMTTVGEELRVASLGGGCGYDFVALAALSAFLGGPGIAATVYEYEPAWRDVLVDVEGVLRDVLGEATPRSNASHYHRCGFEPCDITSPLDAVRNQALLSAVGSTRVFVCSYVVAENAVALRTNRFAFFRQLFAEAPEGSLFLFAETTHRLWPELIDVARETNTNHRSSSLSFSSSHIMRIAIPHIRCGKSGWQLVLFKDSTVGDRGDEAFLEDDPQQKLLERFRRDNLAHLSRLERGWKRHTRKVRGSKQPCPNHQPHRR